MKNKQKAIEKAYGEHWEKVKDFVDENGWIPSSSWNFNLIYEQGKSFHNEKISDLDFYIRPLSLQGIETNNGWIKIESEDDLPNKSCSCWIDVNGKETNTPFWFNLNSKTFHFQGVFYTYNEVSDYQIVERPKQKVY